jgi:uncharacterized protein YdaU (DUF1376 family)
MSIPYLQLYVADYLADTTDLTAEEHGAYLMLLMAMWRNEARLPNDHAKLCRYAKVRPNRWAKVWGVIVRFFDDEGDFISQKRLRHEHEKAFRKSQSCASRGLKGGRPKSDAKPLENNDMGKAKGFETTKLKKAISDIRYQISEYNPLNPPSEPQKQKPKATAEHDRFAAFWDSYPKREGNPRKPASEKFSRLVRDGIDPEEIIRGAQGYAKARQGQDSKFTKQAVTWLNHNCWTEYAAKASAKPAPSGPMVQMKDAEHPVALVIDLVAERGFNGLWGALRERWGPPPDEEGCIIPEWIISKAKDELKKSA